jgi:feruloyl esterase
VRIHGGPRNSAGEQLYAPWPWDTGISSPDWRFWKLESTVPPWENQPLIAVMGAGSLAQVFTTPPTEVAGDPSSLQSFLEGFDFDEDAPKIDATSEAFPESAMAIMTPPSSDDPTLAAFKGAGGKMLIHHGTSDPVFSFLDTVDWYETLMANDPDAADFVRLYAVPGMPHGPGGIAPDQFDMLSVLVAWVEEGETPGPLVATLRRDRDGMPEELAGDTRLLCPWPAVAVTDGEADADRVESFRCEDRN